MPIKLTREGMREIFPRAPQAVIDAFVNNQGALSAAGILSTRTRLLYALSNVEHECAGFTIPNLTENIRYTHDRMHKVWPNRFGSANAVRQKFGSDPGWQLKAFDDIYGNRMGNRPGTSDGSAYIGRGGPQITGRDGYQEVGRRCGLDLVNNPDLASRPEHQPAILAAFWSWKGLNRFADANDFTGCVRIWNGGTNGMADRLAQMAGNDPVVKRLEFSDQTMPAIKTLPQTAPKQPESIAKKTGAVVVVAAGTGLAATQSTDWLMLGLILGAGAIIAAAILTLWKRKS